VRRRLPPTEAHAERAPALGLLSPMRRAATMRPDTHEQRSEVAVAAAGALAKGGGVRLEGLSRQGDANRLGLSVARPPRALRAPERAHCPNAKAPHAHPQSSGRRKMAS
jgi:hypothetical protein